MFDDMLILIFLRNLPCHRTLLFCGKVRWHPAGWSANKGVSSRKSWKNTSDYATVKISPRITSSRKPGSEAFSMIESFCQKSRGAELIEIFPNSSDFDDESETFTIDEAPAVFTMLASPFGRIADHRVMTWLVILNHYLAKIIVFYCFRTAAGTAIPYYPWSAEIGDSTLCHFSVLKRLRKAFHDPGFWNEKYHDSEVTKKRTRQIL